MKIFQKPIALLLSFVLVLSGCSIPFSSSREKYASFQEDLDQNKFKTEENFTMNKLPSNSKFLQIKPSEYSYSLLEKNIENIVRFFEEQKLIPGGQFAMAKMGIDMFLVQIKKVQKISLLFSTTKDLENIDFTELLNTKERSPQEQQKIVVNSLSSALCIAGKAEFSFPEMQSLLQEKISELKEEIANNNPDLRYSIEIQEGSLLFTFGTCPQDISSILDEKDITADFFFAQNKMMKTSEKNQLMNKWN